MLKRKKAMPPSGNNGITIQLQPNRTGKTDLLSALLQLLVPFLCLSGIAFSSAEMLLTGLGLTWHRMPLAAIVLLISLICLCASRLPSAAPWLFLMLLIIYAVFAMLLFPDFYYGFATLANQISNLTLILYELRLFSFSTAAADTMMLTSAKSLTVFIAYPVSLIIVLYYLALYRWHKFFIILLPPGLTITLLLLLSFSPGTGIVLFLLLCSVTLWLWYTTGQYVAVTLRTQRRIISAFTGVLAITLLLAALLSLPGGPSEPTIANMKAAATDFFKANNLYSYRGTANNGGAASGGISGGNTSNADALAHNNTLHMRITTDSLPESTIYLQGFTAGQYSDSGWSSVSGYEDDFSDAELQYQTFIPDTQLQESFLLIEDMTSARYPLHPYAGTQDTLFPYDIETADNTNATYIWAFHSEFYQVASQNRYYLYELAQFWNQTLDEMGSLIITAPELSAEESAYYLTALTDRQDYSLYVETFPEYLALDELPDFSAPQNLEALIVYIQERLAELCTYDLNPGSVPIGADFTDYFLFENQKGFCMHYATAATQLFRLHGVPARYAEGYIATPADFTELENGLYQAELKDNRAHAWTEIYITGIGWIPIETTTFYLGETNSRSTAPIPDSETADSSDEDDDTDEAADAESGEPAAPDDTDTATPAAKESSPSALRKWLIAAAAIAASCVLLAALIWLRRVRLIHRKKQQLQGGDETAALLVLYHELRRLYQFLDQDMDTFADDYPALYRLVQQASFSPHQISREEYERFAQHYQAFTAKQYQALSAWRKLLLRFYHCFLSI